MKANPVSKSKEEQRDFQSSGNIVRIAGTDIPGEASVYHGLTRIKGISWSISNLICRKLEISRNRKISSLSEQEVGKILKFLTSPELPGFLVNRRQDIASGSNKHIITTDLDLQRDFDVRNMKKIRSYKGWRHAQGQPVRGQRTKSHFRKGRSLGVQRSKAAKAATK